MKKIIKILLIIILILPLISLNSFTKAEGPTDFGDAISSEDQSYISDELAETDPDLDAVMSQEEEETGDSDDNDDQEDASVGGFAAADGEGDESSDDEDDGEEVSVDDPDSILKAAEDFADGDIDETLDVEETNKNVNSVYNILLTIGIIVSLIWGVVLGIKFIFGSMEGKAEIKKQLIPYIIWVCVIFGSFIIWSVIVNTFQNNL